MIKIKLEIVFITYNWYNYYKSKEKGEVGLGELLINDDEAKRLITLIKYVFNKHNKVLGENSQGEVKLIGSGNESFILNYRYTQRSKVIHLRESKYNYTLLRINLNNSFHKNSDGNKIFGNRINIFSEEEYYAKGDGRTHYKCHSLPFSNISDSGDFISTFVEFLDYCKVLNPTKVNFVIQGSLFD